MWVDTHVHFPSDPEAIDAWVGNALGAGVDALLAVGGSPELNRSALLAARRHPACVAVALGWDRSRAAGLHAADVEPDSLLPEVPAEARCVAIGEIGLDYHYAKETSADQRRLFLAQLKAAGRRALPVIVHSREADRDTLAALDASATEAAPPAAGPGVLHCFTGSWEFAVALLDRGFYISFSGILTFRNAAALREVAVRIPAERLLIETDAPFLAPVPYRGRSNEPAFVTAVAACLAELRGIRPEQLAETTRANAARLFAWPQG